MDYRWCPEQNNPAYKVPLQKEQRIKCFDMSQICKFEFKLCLEIKDKSKVYES